METLMSAGGYDAIRKQFTPENKRPDYSKVETGATHWSSLESLLTPVTPH
jgi:hypothetical protein